jgi:hypothetical protein
MKNLILASAVLVSAVSSAAFAAGVVELTDANKATIVQKLTDEGYEVKKIKLEHGQDEAYAKNSEGRFEIFLDGDFNVVRIKND